MAVENGAPLTALAFQRGLAPLGPWGHYIVILSVLLFAISTAISWSYYGDRCANYLLGARAILPYKILFILMHFAGAIFAFSAVWTLGDVALGLVTFPNLIALVLLSGSVSQLTRSYFERKPWLFPISKLARIIHKLSTAVPQSSTLTALCFLGLLGVLQEYACGALRCTPCHRGACSTSSRQPMHNPGL